MASTCDWADGARVPLWGREDITELLAPGEGGGMGGQYFGANLTGGLKKGCIMLQGPGGRPKGGLRQSKS